MLGDQLGVVLFQMPPNMKKDLPRLETFLTLLPPTTPAAFEFRHPTWFDDDVLDLLRSQNRPLVVSDTDDLPTTHIDKTADWGYLRLRRVNYSEENLSGLGSAHSRSELERDFCFLQARRRGHRTKASRAVSGTGGFALRTCCRQQKFDA